MASPAQIKANTANAKLSTGPRTAEGKARSSRNGTSHGLSAADVIVFPGEEQAFADLQSGLAQDLRPVGAHQREVFDQLVYHAWNRRRVRDLIANMAYYDLVSMVLNVDRYPLPEGAELPFPAFPEPK